MLENSQSRIHQVGLKVTFLGETLREPLIIGTIVVDHKFVLHPLHLSVLMVIEGGPHPRVFVCVTSHPCCVRSSATCALVVEAPVGGAEWCVAPVNLHATALRCPVIGFPKAWVYFHRLARRVTHPTFLVVLEHPNWDPIHKEASDTRKVKTPSKVQKIIIIKTCQVRVDVLTLNFQVSY